MRRPPLLLLAAVGVLPLLAGCKEVEAEAKKVYEPATVHAVAPGSKAAAVTFTQRGADAVGLAFATSRRLGLFTAVPYAALIYDGDGQPHVYVSPSGLTFQRAPVEIARIAGDEVLIASGLAPGTRVVTVGAAEVWGTELGIAGKH